MIAPLPTKEIATAQEVGVPAQRGHARLACPRCGELLFKSPGSGTEYACPNGHLHDFLSLSVADYWKIESALDLAKAVVQGRQLELRGLAAKVDGSPGDALRILQRADDLQPIAEGLSNLSAQFRHITGETRPS